MKILLYFEAKKQIAQSGIGRAMKHQIKALVLPARPQPPLRRRAVSLWTTAGSLSAPSWRFGAHEKNVGQRDPAGRTARRTG